MENLFIIGNGFDIAHGLPTEYEHFKNYVRDLAKKDRLDELLAELSMLDVPTDYKNSRGDICFNIDKLANYYYRLINTLEDNARRVEKQANAWKDNMVSKYQNWSGFEEYLGWICDLVDWEEPEFISDKEGVPDVFKISANNEGDAHLVAEFWQDATSYLFSNWINGVVNTDEYQELTPCKEVVSKLKDKSYFLTFNYTPVLEEIYDISPEQICHIHGKVRSEIIVGHGNQSDEDCENPLNRRTYQNIILEGVRKKTKERYEKHKEFFDKLNQVKRVVIIGFNLASPDWVDRCYFKQLFSKHIGNKSIEVVFDHYHWQAGQVPTYLNTLVSLGANIKSFTVI